MNGEETVNKDHVGGMLLRDVDSLKVQVAEIGKDMRTVREAMIRIEAQEIGIKLQRLEDGRLKKLEEDVEALKDFKIRQIAIFTTIQVVFSVIVIIIGWYLRSGPVR